MPDIIFLQGLEFCCLRDACVSLALSLAGMAFSVDSNNQLLRIQAKSMPCQPRLPVKRQ